MFPQGEPSRGKTTTRTIALLLVVLVATVPIASVATPMLEEDDRQAEPPDRDVSDLDIDPTRSSLQIDPGKSKTVEVTITNRGNSTVTLDTGYVEIDAAPRKIPEGWVSIDAPASVAPGESVTAEVTVSVPDGAEAHRLYGVVRFTNQTDEDASHLPVDYAHVTLLSLEVERKPTVFVRSRDYFFGETKAGEAFTRTVVVENTGDEAVSLDPRLRTDDGRCYGPGCAQKIDSSWISIDAPAEIGPGETANVTITVAPPADAPSGRYEGTLTLGIDDPARPDHNRYWQRIRLNVGVWSVPEEPVVTTFQVQPDDDTVTVTISAEARSRPTFNVTFVTPSGERITADPVSVTKSTNVDLISDRSRRDDGATYKITYELSSPESGQWSVLVMPYDTPRFEIEITSSEAESRDTE